MTAYANARQPSIIGAALRSDSRTLHLSIIVLFLGEDRLLSNHPPPPGYLLFVQDM
jgi:hypothetical protein